MGYPDGGLRAAERARREQVRWAAADLIEAVRITVCHIGPAQQGRSARIPACPMISRSGKASGQPAMRRPVASSSAS